ncbi:DUF4139 domain-containing protein [Frankia sp. AgB1.9]|uniref:DUF4139 domain-containing protein n=1 Tax=unclassified Frankia TaxID=2632575 RepID=UPI0019315E05|nr:MULTISPECIES: DUF4139 domain-containing protein [unclassified Frankia]MBL7492234.1 DUF4139 domain-containing protein [Frankia sp. AgW1.1]MBL7550090.1 DUF4139 domain-containing protein [Frankia sp. AgB1.9]MBL7621166.1 DUF4139 domain-containing protein [Frankia sp. AgB1.8]
MADPAATVLTLDAPITAVVVYPRQARVTRRGVVTLPSAAGPRPADGSAPPEPAPTGSAAPTEFSVTLGGLPQQIDPNSVRVSGRGAVRVLGVEVDLVTRAATADATLAELQQRLRVLRRRGRELDDAAETEQALRKFLDVAGRNGAAAVARGWGGPSWHGGPAEARGTTSQGGSGEPSGTAGLSTAAAEPPSAEALRLAEIGAALGGQLAELAGRRRTIADEQADLQREITAAETAVAKRQGRARPEQTYQVTVVLEPTAALPSPAGSEPAGSEPAGVEPAGVEVELEVSYLSLNASWSARYDARLVDGTVTLTWFGMVTQSSGEDWPLCDLALSTARPARSSGLPELTPWYVDVARPRPLPPPMVAARSAPDGMGTLAGGSVRMASLAAAPAGAAPVEHAVATVDTSGTAATYRPARPVPVPADGQSHRSTLAILELAAELDHLTVPKLAPEAYLRASVTNASAHTLLAGPIAIFHGADYVGTSALDQPVPPGAEVELQLGVDDRLVVERELVSRATTRKVVGSLRRTDVGYAVTLTNHTGRPARVTVRDQIPVSRHEGVTVKDFHATPAPGETTDLGQLTWPVELAAGATRKIEFGFRLEHNRGLDLTGWAE